MFSSRKRCSSISCDAALAEPVADALDELLGGRGARGDPDDRDAVETTRSSISVSSSIR